MQRSSLGGDGAESKELSSKHAYAIPSPRGRGTGEGEPKLCSLFHLHFVLLRHGR